jgi:hypothetical protein
MRSTELAGSSRPRNLFHARRFGRMVRFCVRRSAHGVEAEDAMHVLLASLEWTWH